MSEFHLQMVSHLATLLAALAAVISSLRNKGKINQVHVLVNSQRATLVNEIDILKAEGTILKAEIAALKKRVVGE